MLSRSVSSVPVNVRPEQYEELRKLATLHERSIAGEVRFALGRYIEEQARAVERSERERVGGWREEGSGG